MAYLIYLFTVLKHKWYVLILCTKAGIPMRGLLHDLSKFSFGEFLVYACHFSGAELREDDPTFEVAKHRHFKRNSHHWQWWLDENGEPRPMDHHSRLEMVCDWLAASLAYPDAKPIAEWFAENRHKIRLHPETYAWVTGELGIEDA